MGSKMFETVMGALVLAVAAAFMMFAYQSSNIKSVEGYPLKAKFTSVAGIGLGTDVRLGGIKIGVVSDLALEPETYKAIVTMQIKDSVKVPTDSSIKVASDGLLGSEYLSLEPGADDKMLAENGLIPQTQSAVNLVDLIGKMAFGGVDSKPAGKDAADKAGVPTIK